MLRLFKKRKVLQEPACQLQEEVKERMDRLKELSAILDFQNYTVPMPNGSVELQMDGGEVGYFSNLLNIKGISVAHTNLPNGGRLGCHKHNEIEHLLCYEGQATLSFKDGLTIVLEPGLMYTIPPHTVHDLVTEPGTKMIALTVPSSPDFPKG
jgi:quercetin dioxygenase-like cupin family protein